MDRGTDLEVLDAGVSTTVQDLGRAGYAHLGVPRSGAAAPAAAALANRLVGNPPAAALLECTAGGVVVRAGSPTVVAVTGAACHVDVDGRSRATGQPVHVPAGGVLRVGAAREGLRSYVALAGGIGGRRVLGSLSYDSLSGLGTPPLSAGDVVHVEPSTGLAAWGDPVVHRPTERVLHLHPGPRLDWLTPAASRLLAGVRCTVGAASNRVGVRLEGLVLERRRSDELPSEGAVRGAVQVPADGRPVVFGPDHPTTGGYPVVAVVRAEDFDVLGQLRPGDDVRLAWAPGQSPAPGLLS